MRWREDRPHQAICVVTHQMLLIDRQELIHNHIRHQLSNSSLIAYDGLLCLGRVWSEQMIGERSIVRDHAIYSAAKVSMNFTHKV
jgi:hypothetical protein